MENKEIEKMVKEVKDAVSINTSIQKQINENADSIEIGSISKGGKIKVYGNFDKSEEFKLKIDKAIELRDYAKVKMVL